MQADQARGASSELAGESDADLMVYMAMSQDDPSTAGSAWAEFYRRHVNYLHAVCLRAYADLLGGEPGVCDLVAETFKRAYENADKFDADAITDPDRLRLRTRAWLGRIAQRIAQTWLRGRSKLPTAFLQQDTWQQVAGAPPTQQATTPRIERVREAILSLSRREQIVIRVTMQWYQPDQAHQRLPNDVAAELAATLKTTPENIRQIRRRAMRKLEAYLRDPAVSAS
ncbi:MAG: sigma-70 family RNA polymerase sigma factor [Phycisphaerae bacterium]|nr:sigma-70 family RNA polymerase sigma factor [Phycisphaerae bacterium]